MEYVNDPKKLDREHYAVLVFGSITIAGDERSRTSPGHGYPEHQQDTIDYIRFDTKEEMETWIARQQPYARFIPALVKPLTVVKTISVK